MGNYDLGSIAYIKAPQSSCLNTGAAFFQSSQDEDLKLKAKENARLPLDIYKTANSDMDKFWQRIWDTYSKQLGQGARNDLLKYNDDYKKGNGDTGILDYGLETAFIKSGIVSQADTVKFYELKQLLENSREAAFEKLAAAFPNSYNTYNPDRGFAPRKFTDEQNKKIEKGDIVEIDGYRNAYYFLYKTLEGIARSVRQ